MWPPLMVVQLGTPPAVVEEPCSEIDGPVVQLMMPSVPALAFGGWTITKGNASKSFSSAVNEPEERDFTLRNAEPVHNELRGIRPCAVRLIPASTNWSAVCVAIRLPLGSIAPQGPAGTSVAFVHT